MNKKLSLYDGVMIVAGSMIGSGIFIVSADIARHVGGGGWLLLTWILAGVMTIMAALSYGELAGMMPNAGGQYVYLKEAYNKMLGFLYGWTSFTVIQTGTIAAVAMAFAKFTGIFFPVVSEKNILVDLGFLKFSGAQILAILSIIFLSLLNTYGIKNGSIVQKIFTSTKLIALFGLIVLGFISFQSSTWSLNWYSFWASVEMIKDENGNWIAQQISGIGLIAALGVAMVGTLFSSDAWNNVTFISSEMNNPAKTVAKSMVIGTCIVTLIYILANVIYLGLLPVNGMPDGPGVIERGVAFATNDRVGTAAASQIFGDSSLYIMAILIMISTFGCNNGLILSGARVYQVMAKDGYFFKQAAELNEYQVPAKALWMQCIWASLLCLSGTYGNLLDYVVFAVLLFYILTVAGVIRLRNTKPDAERPYKTYAYPIIPILYIVFATLICIILLIKKPEFTWPGLGIVLAGIPVYYWMNRKERT